MYPFLYIKCYLDLSGTFKVKCEIERMMLFSNMMKKSFSVDMSFSRKFFLKRFYYVWPLSKNSNRFSVLKVDTI